MTPHSRPLITDLMKERLAGHFSQVMKNLGYRRIDLASFLAPKYDLSEPTTYNILGNLNKGEVYGKSHLQSGGPHRERHAFYWSQLLFTCSVSESHPLIKELRALEPEFFNYPPVNGETFYPLIRKKSPGYNELLESARVVRIYKELNELSHKSYNAVVDIIHQLHRADSLEKRVKGEHISLQDSRKK